MTAQRIPTPTLNQIGARFPHYWQLMRFNRPIGTLLLLWPTLWSLWIAAEGLPPWHLLVIFVAGVATMRAAGCVINDYADRRFDGHVKRTLNRPLVTGKVTEKEALALFACLCLISFVLVLFTNRLTIMLAFVGLILAFCYPFVKRHSHLPQIVLGAAFSWSIPMAYAAVHSDLQSDVWLLYFTTLLWIVVYDTFYAMVDRDDDLRIGVKSTAILFGDQDRLITGVLQCSVLVGLLLLGERRELGFWYDLSVVVCAGLFMYQQWLIRYRQREACFQAFLNNNWVGMAVFVGLALDYAFK